MAKQKVTIVRGTTNTFSVDIVDEDGEAYTLDTGELLRFGIKKAATDAEYIVEKEFSTAGADGSYGFTLDPADTINLPFGKYLYDIGLQSGTDYFNVIPASDFVVGYIVTEWEANS